MRRSIRVLLGVSILSLSLLGSLILMSAAIQNSGQFGALYSSLLIANAVGILIFSALIIANLVRLVKQLRRKAPGARLTLRMLVIFVALAVTPVLILYAFSLDFLRRGIDSWFDVRVEVALNDALNLSRAALDLRMRELLKNTEKMAEEVGRGAAPVTPLNLAALRNPESTIVSNTWLPEPADLGALRARSGADELSLLTGKGRVLAASTVSTNIVPNLPPDALLLQLANGRSYIALDPVRDGGFYIRIAVKVAGSGMGNSRRILHAIYPVSTRMNALASSVESAFAQYTKLAYLRDKLKLSFAMTLTLVLLFSIVTAVWAAFYSANKLAAPIRDLAQGTAAVAKGDYETQLPVAGNDDMGFLVQSFNDMTTRIGAARAEVEAQHEHLIAVLSQLSSGVIVLDAMGLVTTINDSACDILGVQASTVLQTSLDELRDKHDRLRLFVDGVIPNLEAGADHWQKEISMFGSSGRRVLMCRGRPLSLSSRDRAGYVIVFDDITAIIQGQRDAAWSEVARRLAHEIKNPLTPIQLSAERLRRKYLPHMDKDQADPLDRLTNTIIQQVDTMKAMVNTFSDYARPPNLTAGQVSLNDMIDAVLELFRSANPAIEIETHFDQNLPSVSGDAARLRQVFNNLVKNAIEASPTDRNGHIIVTTSALPHGSADHIEVSIEDNGGGIPEDLLENIFEPYVTNKARGTGLGLAIVKKIIEEHGGMVHLANNAGLGATVTIQLPIDANVETVNAAFDKEAI